MNNRDRRILEIVEGIDFEAIRKFLDMLSQTVNVEDDENYKQLIKLIDDLQELESNVMGIPIK